ncbi:META domain-containing protein [Flavobacterium maritimum]|uniref:META domain-containing protein n=1 Tax=Flavobacterium maritimum TaxID=3149042 RepID=UPI0032B3930C
MGKNILWSIIISLFLVACNTVKTNKQASVSEQLDGAWELNYITGPKITFDGLYPNKKPTIVFDLKENRFSGNNSCNSYTGGLNIEGDKINFKSPMAVTKMMCVDSKGETIYMSSLDKIDSYTVSADGKTLSFLMGDTTMMRFGKKM